MTTYVLFMAKPGAVESRAVEVDAHSIIEAVRLTEESNPGLFVHTGQAKSS